VATKTIVKYRPRPAKKVRRRSGGRSGRETGKWAIIAAAGAGMLRKSGQLESMKIPTLVKGAGVEGTLGIALYFFGKSPMLRGAAFGLLSVAAYRYMAGGKAGEGMEGEGANDEISGTI